VAARKVGWARLRAVAGKVAPAAGVVETGQQTGQQRHRSGERALIDNSVRMADVSLP
jgi:hypothetical protein